MNSVQPQRKADVQNTKSQSSVRVLLLFWTGSVCIQGVDLPATRTGSLEAGSWKTETWKAIYSIAIGLCPMKTNSQQCVLVLAIPLLLREPLPKSLIALHVATNMQAQARARSCAIQSERLHTHGTSTLAGGAGGEAATPAPALAPSTMAQSWLAIAKSLLRDGSIEKPRTASPEATCPARCGAS